MTDTNCSAQVDEPLPGTAKAGRLFIALEHHYGWSHDILDGGVFGDEITDRLKHWLGQRGGALQLIRKPGRLGQGACAGVNVYIAHCVPATELTEAELAAALPVASEAAGSPTEKDNAETKKGPDVYLEHLIVSDVTALMNIDIRLGRPTPGATKVDHPLLLICTHGKRDRCCAIKGRPVAAALHNVYPDIVWETSHSKGHRFAPAVVLLPWNYSYGRLSAMAIKDVIDQAKQGVIAAEGCRGRGIFKPPQQVADLAARAHWGKWRADDIATVKVLGKLDTSGSTIRVTAIDGSIAEVVVRQIVTEGVVSSCGDEVGPKKGWVVTEVNTITTH